MIAHSKPWITDADRQAINAVMSGGMLAQGPLVERFEAEAAAYLNVGGAIASASGSAALMLALKALDIGAGDEVILPTYVCKSVSEAVSTLGAIPVLCDVGEDWNMTADAVTPHVTPLTAAIIVVHIFGIPADTYSFKKFRIPLIEDCCQAFGSTFKGVSVGTIGSIGIFSFNAIKCMATGEGGLAVTDDALLLERMRELRDGGDFVASTRIAAPMADLQAALGLSQLSRYDDFKRRRTRIAERYFDELKACAIDLPESVRNESIFFRFPVRAHGADFKDYRKNFETLGVQIRQGVDRLLHRMVGLDKALFPVAERLFQETVSIPIYPALIDEEINSIVKACQKVWNQ